MVKFVIDLIQFISVFRAMNYSAGIIHFWLKGLFNCFFVNKLKLTSHVNE